MRWLACALFAAVVVAASPSASALTAAEQAQLARGESVVEELSLVRDEHRFVGGLAYRVVDADVDSVSRLVRDASRWRDLLPRVSHVELASIDAEGRGHVTLTHRFGPFSGSYSVVIAFTDKGRSGRFWIDTTRENALQDGWGFVRLTPLPSNKTLVSWGVLFDLGDGLFRSMFEAKLQRLSLDVPRRLAHAATR